MSIRIENPLLKTSINVQPGDFCKEQESVCFSRARADLVTDMHEKGFNVHITNSYDGVQTEIAADNVILPE